ncbi:hypothetical protein CYMTET_49293 [Cymbomonas tetramitiformis]|uniref:TH1 domain-containing protein n=1 Tax=Cymbomonas tetramitiformis TaxID=36881 RepID=A0AAE0EUV7_9CHLO|nr:hypothetical protein CYMTET_49293 [Cymbomonas tetramitiformis]
MMTGLPNGLPGVMGILSEDFGANLDADFFLALQAHLRGHPNFTPCAAPSKFSVGSEFRLVAHGREVVYTTKGLRDANTGVAEGLLKNIGLQEAVTRVERASAGGPSTVPGSGTTNWASWSYNRGEELMAMLESCHVHAVQCLKPDPMVLDRRDCKSAHLQDQCSSMPLAEIQRVRQSSYCHRLPFEWVLARYRVCGLKKQLGETFGVYKVGSEIGRQKAVASLMSRILKEHTIHLSHRGMTVFRYTASHEIGKVKLCIQDSQMLSILEELRPIAAARTIQRAWRIHRHPNMRLSVLIRRDLGSALYQRGSPAFQRCDALSQNTEGVSYAKQIAAVNLIAAAWKGHQLRKQMTKEQGLQFDRAARMNNKYMGLKLRRKISVDPLWRKIGFALAIQKTDPRILALLEENRDRTQIVFGARVTKINHVSKAQHRILIISQQQIYMLDKDFDTDTQFPTLKVMLSSSIKGKGRVKRVLPVSCVKALVLSVHQDNMVVIRVAEIEYDILFFSDLKMEIVETIKGCFRDRMGTDLRIEFASDMCLYSPKKGLQLKIVFEGQDLPQNTEPDPPYQKHPSEANTLICYYRRAKYGLQSGVSDSQAIQLALSQIQ